MPFIIIRGVNKKDYWLIFNISGIFVHAQNNLILGTPFSTNIAANQFLPFVFSVAQGGIDEFDLSFQVTGATGNEL